MRLFSILLIYWMLIPVSGKSQFKEIRVDGAIINYIDTGVGVPVIFIHGGMEDYRTWIPQFELFSKKYRVIDYSRRFNYPNQNMQEVKDYSAITEANDLAGIIVVLNLPPAHVVGHSFGAFVALELAIHYPKLVRSLTLSEPPIMGWLPELPGGKALYDDFYGQFLIPVKKDFERKDTAAVLSHTLVYFYGSDLSAALPPEVKAQLISNLPEWRSIAYSTNAFPYVSKTEVKNLTMPVLLLSAGQTMAVLKLTNAELQKLMPKANHFELAEGTHDYWETNPKEMGAALMHFLESISKK